MNPTSRATNRVEYRFVIDSLLWMDRSLKLTETPCPVPSWSQAHVLVRCEIVSNYLAIFHHEANALQLSNVSDRITTDGDEISEFPRLDGANLVLPAQHCRGVGRNRPNHVKGRHSGSMQIEEGDDRGLAAGLSGPEPTHIGSAGKLHPRFQHSLDQLVVELVVTCIGNGMSGTPCRREDDAGLHDLQEEMVVGGRRQVQEYALVTHLLKLLVGRFVAVLDGIGAGIDRCLYGVLVDCVDSKSQVAAVRFFDRRCKLRDGKVLVRRNLDDIHVLEDILPDCLASRLGPINQQELLL